MIDEDWSELDAHLREVLRGHDGVVRKSELLAAGISALQVAALLGRGVLERPRKGWYVDPALPWEAKCAIRVGGVLTCVSAARSWGIPVPPILARQTHVRVPPNTSRRRHSRNSRSYVRPGEDERVVTHWADTSEEAGGWRLGPVDSLAELAGCVDDDWFVVALDAALHRSRDAPPLLSDSASLRLARRLPRRDRRLLRRVDPRSESPIETLLRLGLRRRGIAPFELQVWTHPDHRVDIVVRGRLILEADGEEFHEPAKDAIRDALMRRLGYVVLRFDYQRIVFDLDAVLDEIEQVLASFVV